jgi:hypothetical protein
MGALRARLTYANVVATLALFLAVGGGAYAVSKVGSKEIRRNAVKSRHLAPNAAKGRDVRESTLGIVPNAARLGGLPLGQIVGQIDFRELGATNAEPAELTQRVGGIELTVRCSQVGGIGTDALLELVGVNTANAAVIFDSTHSDSGNPPTFASRAGGFDGNSSTTLFSEQDVSARGNLWIVWREPSRTVSIQGRYDASRDLTADCALNAVVTIAPT